MHDVQDAARRSRRALAVRDSLPFVPGAGVFAIVHRDAGGGAVVETLLSVRPGPLAWAGLGSVAAPIVRRLTAKEEPPDGFDHDEARAHYVLGATFREGAA